MATRASSLCFTVVLLISTHQVFFRAASSPALSPALLLRRLLQLAFDFAYHRPPLVRLCARNLVNQRRGDLQPRQVGLHGGENLAAAVLVEIRLRHNLDLYRIIAPLREHILA